MYPGWSADVQTLETNNKLRDSRRPKYIFIFSALAGYTYLVGVELRVAISCEHGTKSSCASVIKSPFPVTYIKIMSRLKKKIL